MAKYLYNGIELPALPEWDKKTYPYTAIFYFAGGSGKDPYYQFVAGKEPITRYDPALGSNYYYRNNTTGWVYRLINNPDTITNETVWGDEYVQTTVFASDYKVDLIWANHDVIKEKDGSVYLAASDPVPVGGATPEYAIIPTADYKAACDAIRAKTGKTDLIKSGDMAAEIENVPTGGASFNIHYGTTAPEDTSKLWVETDTEPTETRVTSDISGECSIEQLDEFLSFPHYYGGSAVVGNRLYYFGGLVDHKEVSTIYYYDVITKQSVLCNAKLGGVLRNICAVTVGTKVYLFGGYNGSSNVKTISIYDTETDSITTSSSVISLALNDICGVADGDNIYLFGGQKSSGTSSSIWLYNTATDTINTLTATLPNASTPKNGVKYGDKIYLFGGNTTNAILKFDLASLAITTIDTTLPSKNWGMASFALGTKIYLVGGYTGTTIFVFDAVTQEIETLSLVLPVSLDRAGVFLDGTRAYLFGGGSSYNLIHLFTISSYLTENTAAVVPSLTENVFPLMDVVELGVSAVYIGNADGLAEQVNAYLYNETTAAWELI